jgi:hypothetical protein
VNNETPNGRVDEVLSGQATIRRILYNGRHESGEFRLSAYDKTCRRMLEDQLMEARSSEIIGVTNLNY